MLKRINILDVLLLLVVIAAGIFVLTRDTVSVLPATTSENTYIIRFYTPSVNDFVADHINIGDPVTDHLRDMSFGTITNIEVGEGLEFHPDSAGVLQASPRGGMISLEITSKVSAGALDNGLIIQGNRFAVGQSVTIRAGDSVLFLRISGLESV